MREIKICTDDIVINIPDVGCRPIDVVVDGGHHYARLPVGRYVIEGDGVVEVVDVPSYGPRREIVEIPDDASVFVLGETTHPVEYWDERTGRILTLSEYHDERTRLESSGRPDFNGELVFERLDDRHAWEAFLRCVWHSAKAVVSTRTPATLCFRTVPVSDHECIQPLRWVRGTLDLDSGEVGTCVYTPPVMDMLWEAARATGLSFEIPDRSVRDQKLECLLIDESYCNWDKRRPGIGRRGSLVGYTGSYDECVRHYIQHRESILSIFQDVLMSRKVDLTNGDLLRRLSAIGETVRVDPDAADAALADIIREITGGE